MFNNNVWVIKKLRTAIPEDPFEVLINGKSMGRTKLLSFAKRVPNTNRFPQVLVIYSSGYLRLKVGADPTPTLPFGQSLVLGPAISGTSTSFPKRTLFFHPQLQRVAVDTSQLGRDGTGRLLIQITSSRSSSPNSATTNQIMNLSWALILEDPSDLATTLHVAGTFELTEDVVPDPVQTEKFESVRLLQVSTMYIDNVRHDVDALRFLTGGNVVTLSYSPALANLLLPISPTSLDQGMPMFDSVHTDDVGQPNGNTPSYRIRINSTTGPMTGPIMVRAFFNRSQNLHNDNLGLWAFQQPPASIKKGTTGNIDYTVIASINPHSLQLRPLLPD
ncbi:hypothetical protein [Nitrosospira sp. Is2]|uniref:hypothetical protein n=1 Tax=Nitrosospira sp. Is2 TaxID=3080532 RepID=UPI002953E27F|nr:hypothetical protein [Nitrosospira sp. Is2]WON74125.1 hypothetical protein R5L00_01140 [Nitrosospira sp. Is2]